MDNPQSAHIKLDHLSDRELLLLTAQAVNDLKAQIAVQNGRVRSLETWRWLLSGGLLVVAAMASWIMSKLP